MQTQQPNVSAQELKQQIQQAARDAQVAAEKAASHATARITTPDGRTIVVGPPAPIGGTETRAIDPNLMIPPQAEDIAIAFFVMIGAIIVGLPLMRAIARRIERGGSQPAAIPNDVRAQLQQISASVDAIAIEVERISEAQRFQSKLLAEKSPAGTVLTPGAERQ